MWLEVAKIGAQLLGAKAASDAAKANAKASQTDLKKLVKDAESAGFNPLTVLRATGGQGFNKGSSGALASATFWGNFANAGQSALNDFDPYNQKRKELDIKQAQAALANTIASTQLMKQQTVGVLSSNTTAVVPKSFDVPIGIGDLPVQPVAPDVRVTTTSDGKYVDDKISSVVGNYVDPETGQIFQQPLGEDPSEIAANTARRGVMKIQAMEVPQLSFNRFSRNRGNGQVTTNYRINKNDISAGVLPPLSRTFFISQGKAMQIR